MSENEIDSQNISKPAPDAAKPKGARKAKKAKPAKKAGRAKKAAAKPKVDRINKKAEVIAMMKRAKGAELLDFLNSCGISPVRTMPPEPPDRARRCSSFPARIAYPVKPAPS